MHGTSTTPGVGQRSVSKHMRFSADAAELEDTARRGSCAAGLDDKLYREVFDAIGHIEHDSKAWPIHHCERSRRGVASCCEAVIEPLQFSKPKNGRNVKVRYPFELRY